MIIRKLPLIVLFSFSIIHTSSATSIPLADAVKQKKIRLETKKFIPPTDGNYQNEAAQSAVWAITNDYSPYSIYDDDTSVMNGLRRTVCKLKKIAFDPKEGRVVDNTPLIRYISGSFTFSIYKEQKVDLVIFT